MNIKLDTVLSLVLVSAFILSFGLAPTTTPFWLFLLIFVGLLSMVGLDLSSVKKKKYDLVKDVILVLLIVSVIGSAFLSTIQLRRQTASTYNVHDIVIQQEVAVRFLLLGKNPYKETYFDTPLEDWHYDEKAENPALYHYVNEPLYLLFAIPFFEVSGRAWGFFDARLPLIFLFTTTMIFAYLLVKDGEKRRSLLVLLAFTPLSAGYLIEGRSDFFMLGFLLPGLYFLYKRKNIISAILIALAFAVKQSVWPLFPFYFAYLWFSSKNKKEAIKPLVIFSAVFLIIVAPFFFWDPKAFLDSTIFYLSGNTEHAYPISGYGFGMLLNQIGIIKNLNDKFPFVILQLMVCIPLLVMLVKYLRKNLSVKTMVLTYSIFLFVYWYFARYFNNSHIMYISLLFILAYFWPEAEEKK